jgi:hypothetical protein
LISSQVSQLEREAARICELIRRLEEIPVLSAAKLLKKSPKWVRANLPIVIHGPKSHHVRLVDVDAYQTRRTVRPKVNDSKPYNNAG